MSKRRKRPACFQVEKYDENSGTWVHVPARGQEPFKKTSAARAWIVQQPANGGRYRVVNVTAQFTIELIETVEVRVTDDEQLPTADANQEDPPAGS